MTVLRTRVQRKAGEAEAHFPQGRFLTPRYLGGSFSSAAAAAGSWTTISSSGAFRGAPGSISGAPLESAGTRAAASGSSFTPG